MLSLLWTPRATAHPPECPHDPLRPCVPDCHPLQPFDVCPPQKKKPVQGRLKILEGTTTSTCTAAGVLAVLERKSSVVKRCYEKHLKKTPTLMGKIALNWQIKRSGKASDVLVEYSTLNHDAVETCIQSAIGRMRFPKPQGEPCKASFPFIMAPES
ncbi:MAG: AgmX/PglI C-terminal domain-containing protein [Bradymonadia bacterium]